MDMRSPAVPPGARRSVVAGIVEQTLLDDPNRPLADRATREIYPPGSTFKVVTTAAALAQENGVDLNTRLTASPQITLHEDGARYALTPRGWQTVAVPERSEEVRLRLRHGRVRESAS